ncbi:MAG: acyl-CoA dehydrogenase family protein [Thermodesulfobacteriota bacterium]|nr:acyl-CoA dehydrogenase family protein [Thermodesulfobacteriota bacterium]
MNEQYQLTGEQKILKETVRRMAREKIGPRAAEIDETGEFPWDVREQFREMGLFGLVFPEEYGGSNAGMLSAALVLEEIAVVCSSSAFICAAPIPAGRIILESGNEKQKANFLPPIVSGDMIGAFALTESEAEADTVRITTRAEKKGNLYIINGSKSFISLADVAGFMIVFAKTKKDNEPDSVSVFIVAKDTPGWAVKRIEKKMGTQAVHACELIFDNCPIPEANRIGAEGEGVIIATKAMGINCAITAARALGLSQGALDYSLKYSKERVQFGRPISSFQGIQFILADMAMQIEAGRYLLYRACGELDDGGNEAHLLVSMAKCFITDVAMKVTTDAVQVLGGYGYMKDHPLERMMRDAKLTQLVEGTNQLQRLIVGRELFRSQRGFQRDEERGG